MERSWSVSINVQFMPHREYHVHVVFPVRYRLNRYVKDSVNSVICIENVAMETTVHSFTIVALKVPNIRFCENPYSGRESD
jgi:hypothetical protein